MSSSETTVTCFKTIIQVEEKVVIQKNSSDKYIQKIQMS